MPKLLEQKSHVHLHVCAECERDGVPDRLLQQCYIVQRTMSLLPSDPWNERRRPSSDLWGDPLANTQVQANHEENFQVAPVHVPADNFFLFQLIVPLDFGINFRQCLNC